MPAFVKVPLSRGKVALIDPEDAARVLRHRWTASYGKAGWKAYFSHSINGKTHSVYLHQLVMGHRKGLMIDHRNGNGLDCRKRNLRFCTNSQNSQNRRRKKNNQTGYKGIFLIKETGMWVAEIVVNGVRHRLGRYRSSEEAAHVYDDAARRLHGDFAALNFPRRGERKAR